MTDVHCARCGKAWKSEGVRHHTAMAAGEVRRFLLGLDCPVCWGQPVTTPPGADDRFLADLRATSLDADRKVILDELALQRGGEHDE